MMFFPWSAQFFKKNLVFESEILISSSVTKVTAAAQCHLKGHFKTYSNTFQKKGKTTNLVAFLLCQPL